MARKSISKRIKGLLKVVINKNTISISENNKSISIAGFQFNFEGTDGEFEFTLSEDWHISQNENMVIGYTMGEEYTMPNNMFSYTGTLKSISNLILCDQNADRYTVELTYISDNVNTIEGNVETLDRVVENMNEKPPANKKSAKKSTPRQKGY